MAESISQITRLLHACRSGDSDAMDQLMPLVYEQLRSLAVHYMRRERTEHTLQATALVHEAYLKMFDATTDWEDRAHFLAIAAITMRRVLVEHARSSKRMKRGNGAERIELDDLLLVQPPMNRRHFVVGLCLVATDGAGLAQGAPYRTDILWRNERRRSGPCPGRFDRHG